VAKDTNTDTVLQHEIEIIQLVLRFGRLIGLQKSVCEIYGYLFASISPQSMEQISKRLNMSLGSASQGLKILKSLGAVRVVYISGERKDRFQAEFNFREIVAKFLNEEIRPQLSGTDDKILEISEMISDLPDDMKTTIQTRLDIIKKLNKRANQVVPAVSKILSL